MQHLVFQTEIPFGYIFFTLSLLALALVAGAAICVGLRRAPRKFGLVASGCTLLTLVIATVAANLNEEAVDLNPLILKTSELVGVWRDSTSEIALHPDGRYKCNGNVCTRLGESGAWERSGDFFISFLPSESKKEVWRVTALAGHLRLNVSNVPYASGIEQSEFTLEHTPSWPSDRRKNAAPN